MADIKEEIQNAIDAIEAIELYEKEIDRNVKLNRATEFQKGFKAGLSWCRTLKSAEKVINKKIKDLKHKKEINRKVRRRRFI